FVGDVGERAVAVVVKHLDAAAVVGGFHVLGEKPGRVRMKNIDRLEIAGHKQVHVTVPIVVESDGGDGVEIPVETGPTGDLFEPAVAEILKELIVAETNYQQIRPAVVVVIEPQRG